MGEEEKQVNVEDTKQEETQEPKVEESQQEEVSNKEEEKQEEVKDNSSNNKKATKAELQNQLKDLQEDYDILNSQLAEKDQKIKDLELALEAYKTKGGKVNSEVESLTNTLTQVVEDMKSKLPENFKDLVPEGDVKVQFSWLQKALKNVNTNDKKNPPNVEIGKPINLGNKGEDNGETKNEGNFLSQYFSRRNKK